MAQCPNSWRLSWKGSSAAIAGFGVHANVCIPAGDHMHLGAGRVTPGALRWPPSG